MAHRTERLNVRVDLERARRYREAAGRLGFEELSDFIRRGCDDLADRAGASHNTSGPARAAKPTVARPLSKKEQAAGKRDR